MAAALEQGGACVFDILFQKNVPHLIEKIFLGLDYESFKACSYVCNSWSEFLTSNSFQMRAQSVFKEEIEGEKEILLTASRDGWRDGSMEVIATILSSGMVKVDSEGYGGSTPLLEAVNGNNNNVVQFLLQRGADPNKGNKTINDSTPLYMAARNGNKRMAKVLLNGGAHPNKVNRRGGTV